MRRLAKLWVVRGEVWDAYWNCSIVPSGRRALGRRALVG